MYPIYPILAFLAAYAVNSHREIASALVHKILRFGCYFLAVCLFLFRVNATHRNHSGNIN
jgi:hypothetical protein